MKTYKAAPTNVNKGNMTHGSFKNSGQKPGKKKTVKKEKQTDYVTKRLARLSRGLMHVNKGNPMHAQENA